MYNPRPSDKARFRALLQKLTGLHLQPVQDEESGWWTAFIGADELPRAVALEDFFVGNPNTCATFAANIPEHPGEDAFFAHFQQVRARPDVAGVLMGVSQLEFDGSEDDWPYAEAVYIITTARPEAISPEAVSIYTDDDPPVMGQGWFGKYFPDEITPIAYQEGLARYGLPRPPEGHTLYMLWWD